MLRHMLMESLLSFAQQLTRDCLTWVLSSLATTMERLTLSKQTWRTSWQQWIHSLTWHKIQILRMLELMQFSLWETSSLHSLKSWHESQMITNLDDAWYSTSWITFRTTWMIGQLFRSFCLMMLGIATTPKSSQMLSLHGMIQARIEHSRLQYLMKFQKSSKLAWSSMHQWLEQLLSCIQIWQQAQTSPLTLRSFHFRQSLHSMASSSLFFGMLARMIQPSAHMTQAHISRHFATPTKIMASTQSSSLQMSRVFNWRTTLRGSRRLSQGPRSSRVWPISTGAGILRQWSSTLSHALTLSGMTAMSSHHLSFQSLKTLLVLTRWTACTISRSSLHQDSRGFHKQLECLRVMWVLRRSTFHNSQRSMAGRATHSWPMCHWHRLIFQSLRYVLAQSSHIVWTWRRQISLAWPLFQEACSVTVSL